MAKRKSAKANGNASGANLGFEATLWAAADKLRNNMDSGEYKHVVLGDKASRSKDILSRVYDYFLSQFARVEGKN